MDTTMFLAQMWGPAILAVGLGIFVSRKYYIKIYRDLEKEPLAVLVFGMIAIAAGIAHIQFHNTWDTFPQIVVSFLGWALLVKGLVFAIAPGFVDRAGDWEAKSKLVPVGGVLTIIAGVYLTYIAFLV